MSDDIKVLVYTGPDHEMAKWLDENNFDGDPFIFWRDGSTTAARYGREAPKGQRGQLIPDGWVLCYGSGDEHIIGPWGDADEVATHAKELLQRFRELNTELRYLTACHEAGHAVAAVMRGGGELVSVTIGHTADHLGYTRHRSKSCAPHDALFVTFAGPWAEARAQWTEPTLDGVDVDGCTFDDHLNAAWWQAAHGDYDAYNSMRDDQLVVAIGTVAAEHLGIHPDELTDRQERGWGHELERVWPVIQQVADMLLAGEAVTDAVVRGLVDASIMASLTE